MEIKRIESLRIESLVTSTLFDIDMASDDAIALIMGTGAVESGFRTLKQVGGPARSWWQVEPMTAQDNLNSYLRFRPALWDKVCQTAIVPHLVLTYVADELVRLLEVNIAFAICMARIKYWRYPEPLPRYDDIEGQAEYWLKAYNSGGKGTIERYIEANRMLKLS